ncbi:MAG TPA: tetratricopeptide repeat protein [Acidimicrobiales bacterium]|nr:tetratricopeptide repeat protein [Acidimicrobiales bacterium]
MAMSAACRRSGCGGSVLADGYCDTCGAKGGPPPAATPAATPAPTPAAASSATPAAPGPGSRITARSLVTGSARARGSRRTASARTRTSSRRTTIGAGLLDVAPAAAVDPSTVVMDDPQVAEEKRYCSKCGAPVGRSKGGQPGRQQGFCGRCRHPFDFVPKLQPRELVAGQYQVVGALAHGGLGWIYLAQDKAVSDRWVVLKGLVDAGDEAATVNAVAERRFLAQVEHANIVEIYNFVTHKRAGYTVMEYVGGPSLKQVLKARRAANPSNEDDPLPVDQAIAYVLAVLPAFTYLHARGLVYCDFKPDNLIQVGDQMKLIDLGGVRRIDDPTGDIYGTVGFQAPEIAEMGPSIPSDLYTIGRTLAVLTLDFDGYQSTYQYELPDPAGHPALAQHESFHRFLLKATAPHPDDRFQSTPELGDQLLGVLREVVATTTRTPQPAASSLFAGIPVDSSLPTLTVEAADPAAGFLANLPSAPVDAIAAIDAAVTAGQVEPTVEVRLRIARALVETGDAAGAAAQLDQVEAADPWEWRAVWLRGVLALGAGDVVDAGAAFDRCATEVPGELAPKLALAATAERAGDHAAAAARYDVVATVDPSYVGAVLGLARTRLAVGDVTGALEAYQRVPRTHRAYGDAQRAAVRTLAQGGRFADAAELLERTTLGGHDRAALDVEVLEAALVALESGSQPADPKTRLAGHPLTERSLRQGLEAAYRLLAARTPERSERVRLVDRANAVRPRSLV